MFLLYYVVRDPRGIGPHFVGWCLLAQAISLPYWWTWYCDSENTTAMSAPMPVPGVVGGVGGVQGGIVSNNVPNIYIHKERERERGLHSILMKSMTGKIGFIEVCLTYTLPDSLWVPSAISALSLFGFYWLVIYLIGLLITCSNVLSVNYMPHCLNALCSLSASTSSDALIAPSALCPQ